MLGNQESVHVNHITGKFQVFNKINLLQYIMKIRFQHDQHKLMIYYTHTHAYIITYICTSYLI